MGQKTKQVTNLPPPSAEELRLQDIAARLGGEQLSAIQSYAPYREQLFGMIPSLGNALARDLGLQLPAGTFRQITPEERAYQEFLNTAPPGYTGPSSDSISRNKGLERILGHSPSNQLLAGTSVEFLGGGGAKLLGKEKKKRAAQAAAAAAEEAARQERAAWEAKAAELKAASEASVQGQSGSASAGGELGIDQALWEYGYSPYEADLVNQLADEQLALGGSDIDAAYTESLRNLAQNLAPGRGMRGYDTPILDRGGLLAMENVRQKSQLSRGLRAQSSQQLLNLSEQAKQNRMQLMGFLGNQGLGLGTGDALGAAKSLQQERTARATTATGTAGLGLSDVGSIASGAGALITAFSSREIKDVGTRLSGTAVLAKLRKLPIYRWSYKEDPTPHLGPMAEDFRDAFKVGDGKTLALVDVMGVLLAAMQGLAQAQHEEVHHG